MTYPEHQLRQRLEHILAAQQWPGSLYLAALGCLSLAVDEENKDAETMLEAMYQAQAAAEGCDPDELLVRLIEVKP